MEKGRVFVEGGSSTAQPISRRRSWVRGPLAYLLAVFAVGGFTSRGALAAGAISVIGVENEYADVIAQIGGRYVQVRAIEAAPNTDPHSFEASPAIAREIAGADLVVKNGVGYDAWVEKIMSAAPNAARKVIDVQHLLHLPDDSPNPHLWYDPRAMSAVATAVAADLSALDPAEARYFQANAAKFEASLKPWIDAMASFNAQFGGTRVAVTEPVADYMLKAAGCHIVTPFSLQTAIMNGTDPSPQDVATQEGLLVGHGVKVLVYNQQVTHPLTQSFLSLAKKNGIPIVGVYETMPAPGYTYQTWMLAEVAALRKAVTDNVSTEKLGPGHS